MNDIVVQSFVSRSLLSCCAVRGAWLLWSRAHRGTLFLFSVSLFPWHCSLVVTICHDTQPGPWTNGPAAMGETEQGEKGLARGKADGWGWFATVIQVCISVLWYYTHLGQKLTFLVLLYPSIAFILFDFYASPLSSLESLQLASTQALDDDD